MNIEIIGADEAANAAVGRRVQEFQTHLKRNGGVAVQPKPARYWHASKVLFVTASDLGHGQEVRQEVTEFACNSECYTGSLIEVQALREGLADEECDLSVTARAVVEAIIAQAVAEKCGDVVIC